MSAKHKAKLRKAREQLHKQANLMKLYKARLGGDEQALIRYVQGTAEFGQYVLECIANQPPERSQLVYAAAVAYAEKKGLIAYVHDKWEVTHVCNNVDAAKET